MATSKLISVITPTYNGNDTIFTAIEALLKQSYDNIQYIIVDDGSEFFDEKQIKDYVEKNKREMGYGRSF